MVTGLVNSTRVETNVNQVVSNFVWCLFQHAIDNNAQVLLDGALYPNIPHSLSDFLYSITQLKSNACRK